MGNKVLDRMGETSRTFPFGNGEKAAWRKEFMWWALDRSQGLAHAFKEDLKDNYNRVTGIMEDWSDN